ncbi:3-hydroxyacyl-[acyl-carrier-protein] dehydratase [Burkholderiales bacterium]|nr:3-hydroxyacyl-[acyl-carrier-protein] dehydratase [Burkholderiales bacterium]
MPAIPPTDIQEVIRHLPHRFPFVLVDFVEGGEAGEWVRAVKHVSVDEPFFANLGTERPSMPHSLIVEALAQAGGILCFYSGLLKPMSGSTTFLAAIGNTRFERGAYAGETLVLDCRLKRALRGVVRLEGRASVRDELVVATELTMVVRDTDDARAADDPRTVT